jgi:hypothetical protein
MGPVARVRLDRAEAIIRRVEVLIRVVDANAVMHIGVFVERLAYVRSLMVVMMMMMMVRAGHSGGRMLECNVLARNGFSGTRSA